MKRKGVPIEVVLIFNYGEDGKVSGISLDSRGELGRQ